MMPKIEISASVLSADFACLKEAMKRCHSSGIDSIHLDIMDGHFVPNISFGPVVVRALRPLTKLPMDAHLMIENPQWYIDDFAKAGADIITVHAECFSPPSLKPQQANEFPKKTDSVDEGKLLEVIKKIKSANKKVGLAFNPPSPINITDKLLNKLNEVLIMSVNPGFSGQTFIQEVLPKIRELRKRYKGNIQVDGGINDQTASQVIKSGANMLVTASYFFNAKDPKKVVELLKISH
ncbi:MAG: ribulose-phosphate 3-epimerase [Planctomycetota bacterium]